MYTLVNNTSQKNLLDELTQSLADCSRFYFNVAFVSYSGVQLLLDSFKLAESKGILGKFITGTYLNFTDPKAIRKLKTFNDFDVRVFLATETQGFHPKAYIFEYDDFYKVIIGSSNLTNYALKSNIEWNLQVIAKNDATNEEFLNYLKDTFNSDYIAVYLVDRYTIKVIDTNNDIGYFKYNIKTKNIDFIDNYNKSKEMER